MGWQFKWNQLIPVLVAVKSTVNPTLQPTLNGHPNQVWCSVNSVSGRKLLISSAYHPRVTPQRRHWRMQYLTWLYIPPPPPPPPPTPCLRATSIALEVNGMKTPSIQTPGILAQTSLKTGLWLQRHAMVLSNTRQPSHFLNQTPALTWFTQITKHLSPIVQTTHQKQEWAITLLWYMMYHWNSLDLLALPGKCTVTAKLTLTNCAKIWTPLPYISSRTEKTYHQRKAGIAFSQLWVPPYPSRYFTTSATCRGLKESHGSTRMPLKKNKAQWISSPMRSLQVTA